MLHNPAIQFDTHRWFYFVAYQNSLSGETLAAAYRIGSQVALHWTVDFRGWFQSLAPFPADLDDHLEKRLAMIRTIATSKSEPLQVIRLDCKGDDPLVAELLGHFDWFKQLTSSAADPLDPLTH